SRIFENSGLTTHFVKSRPTQPPHYQFAPMLPKAFALRECTLRGTPRSLSWRNGRLMTGDDGEDWFVPSQKCTTLILLRSSRQGDSSQRSIGMSCSTT